MNPMFKRTATAILLRNQGDLLHAVSVLTRGAGHGAIADNLAVRARVSEMAAAMVDPGVEKEISRIIEVELAIDSMTEDLERVVR